MWSNASGEILDQLRGIVHQAEGLLEEQVKG